MTKEEQLKYEYEQKLEALRREQANCQHEWEEVKYDPKIETVPKYKGIFRGSDYMPEFDGVEEKKSDRWSRTCKKCGKVEYTTERVPVAYEPKF